MKYQNILFIIFLLLGCKKEIANSPVNTATTYNTNESYEASKDHDKYKLVWSDEFNYTGLPDSTHWGYQRGHHNDEAQFYETYNLANSKVKNGVLTITALYDKAQKYPITSANIITLHKFSFKYGRIEVSAKMPVGSGAWPAIWLLGTNKDTISWPGCGEIDIMEWLGRAPQFVNGSIYTITASGKDTSRVSPTFVLNFKSLSSHFHTYAIEWDSTAISYYFDDNKYVTYKANQITKGEWAPFKKPFYLLLNLALGGSSGGTIDYSKFPFTYQIDYVRYYQKK